MCAMTSIRRLSLLALFLSLTACVQAKTSEQGDWSSSGSLPTMRWDHRPEAAHWTSRSLMAIAAEDASLAARVPADIDSWCPGYEENSLAERRAFWAGILSATAKYESSWNPAASGGGGRYIGIMQISPRSAQNYGCEADSAGELKDGAANLECAVEIMAQNVGRDGVVAGSGRQGIGRDWMPLRKGESRGEMAAWTAAQSYCQ